MIILVILLMMVIFLVVDLYSGDIFVMVMSKFYGVNKSSKDNMYIE